AGYRNRFRHPDASVLARYAAHGIAVSRTDLDGAVPWRLAADGAIDRRSWRASAVRYWHDRPATGQSRSTIDEGDPVSDEFSREPIYGMPRVCVGVHLARLVRRSGAGGAALNDRESRSSYQHAFRRDVRGRPDRARALSREVATSGENRKMSHDLFEDRDGMAVNPSTAPTIAEIIDACLSRRALLKGIGAGSAFGLFGCASLTTTSSADGSAPLTFTEIGRTTDDKHYLAPGYNAQVLIGQGDPIHR